jgi:hypothetical protein
MPRTTSWKVLAIITSTTTVLLGLLLLPACCCVRGPAAPSTNAPPPMQIPPIGELPLPDFSESHVRAPTETLMTNVWFYYDPVMFLDIHTMRGEMISKPPGQPVNFDDRNKFTLRVDTGTIGMKSASLDKMMNQYLFGYPDAPLRNLHITMDGKQLKQEGIMHKIVDIPFTMWADVSADHGLIRIHPTKISICGINGLGLLKAVGQSLEKMLKMPVEKGVRAESNDLLLDPQKVLPAPSVELKLTGVRVEGDELIQLFDAGLHLPPLDLPRPQEKNMMYLRGGTLRMGKLLMIDADMQVIDTDPTDPFKFFIDHYNDQLVAGWEYNRPNYGLTVYMRDWDDLGKPPREGEKLAPK